MKKIFSLLICLLCSGILWAQSPRVVTNFNEGWKFRLGDDPSWALPSADDSQWRTVDLPHDFQIEQPWVEPDASERPDNSDAGANIRSRLSARGFKEMGSGWYRKSFTPSTEWKNKRILLDVEGIMLVGDVYLNGELIGGTNYGYIGFEIDLTGKLKFDQQNVLAVRANTGEPRNSRWYTGGGLYRDVHIVCTDRTLHFMRHPLYITTKNNTIVSIQAEARCTTKQNTIAMHVVVKDPKGTVVYDQRHDVKRNRNARYEEYQLPEINVANPQLWDCETPNLYTASVELISENGEVTDVAEQTFGFRTIEFGPDYGFKLNGKKVLLKGYANHHTLGALGAAAYPRAMEKRIQLMKSFGINHIRTSHNPYSQSFLDLCDKYGILVVDEIYDKWNAQYVGAGRSDWTHEWQDNVPEWIKRDRSHPSVIMWSLGNELQSYNDQPYNDWGVTCFNLQRTLIHRYDKTRKVTVAMHPRYRNWETDSLPCDLAMVTDIQAYNYRYMYFPGDGKKFPWMTFYQSEASVAAMGENYFSMDLNKVIGLAYWGAIDYLGESAGWPAKGWAQGVFDISLQPKPKAYYMKSFFSDEPVVHISVKGAERKLNWNGVNLSTSSQTDVWEGTEGQKLPLIIYTNADEVELFVNGESQGVRKNDKSNPKMRNQIRWDDVVFHAGYAEAIARTDGKVVARHRIESVGEPVALKVETDNPSWHADGIDLQHVRITAVDKKGRRVNTAHHELQFRVDGNARLVAVSNGDINSEQLNATDHIRLYEGTALVILRAGTSPSRITLTTTSDKYKTIVTKMATK